MSWKLDDKNTSDYLELCRRAVKDDKVFANFRRMNPMNMIVENSPLKSGIEYFKCIEQFYPWLFEYIDKFITSETVGNPETYALPDNALKPTTLRYVKTLGDLHKYFGSLGNKVIAEIGGGYGGLCKIIHDVYKPKRYLIYDLPEAQALQDKFLTRFDVPCQFADLQVKCPAVDLLIAMYSWSELSEDLQVEYLNKVIKKAKNCYIMLNYDMESSYSLLREAFPKADITDWNMFYDERNNEYAPYNRFIIIKN